MLAFSSMNTVFLNHRRRQRSVLARGITDELHRPTRRPNTGARRVRGTRENVSAGRIGDSLMLLTSMPSPLDSGKVLLAGTVSANGRKGSLHLDITARSANGAVRDHNKERSDRFE
jgi:hypothetical protein